MNLPLIISRIIKALGTTLATGTLYYLLLNWWVGGTWSGGYYLLLTIATVGSGIMALTVADEDEVPPTWKSLGKGILIGILIYIILGIICVVFKLPEWASVMVTGLSMVVTSISATDKEILGK